MDRPEGNPILRQISAGDTQVWAVDIQGRLYRRKDVVSVLPEGTSWELVDEHVLHVSVGRHDQVGFELDTYRWNLNQPNRLGLGGIGHSDEGSESQRERFYLYQKRNNCILSCWHWMGVCNWGKIIVNQKITKDPVDLCKIMIVSLVIRYEFYRVVGALSAIAGTTFHFNKCEFNVHLNVSVQETIHIKITL